MRRNISSREQDSGRGLRARPQSKRFWESAVRTLVRSCSFGGRRIGQRATTRSKKLIDYYKYPYGQMKLDKKVVVYCQNKEILIPCQRLVDEGLFAGLPAQIQLPFQVKFNHFLFFIKYLNKEPLPPVTISDIQHIVSLCGLVSWKNFSDYIAKKVLEPAITPQTCFQIIEQTIRAKSKMGKSSGVQWVVSVLKSQIAKTAKCLLSPLCDVSRLNKLDFKFADDVLQKCLKYCFTEVNEPRIMQILRTVAPACSSELDLLYHFKARLYHKVNFALAQMNILKTLNLQNLRDKQTTPFRLNDISWKFVSRVELENGSRSIHVYLRLQKVEEAFLQRYNVLALYHFHRIQNHPSNQTMVLHYIQARQGEQIYIGTIDLVKAQGYKKIQFSISLNVDFKLSLLLTRLAESEYAVVSRLSAEEKAIVFRARTSLGYEEENKQKANRQKRKSSWLQTDTFAVRRTNTLSRSNVKQLLKKRSSLNAIGAEWRGERKADIVGEIDISNFMLDRQFRV